jgi:hypothetical protein
MSKATIHYARVDEPDLFETMKIVYALPDLGISID